MGTLAGRLIVTALTIAGVACAARAPQTPHVWQLRGAVASVHDTALEVRHKTGSVVRLTVDEHTEYVRSESPASLQSLNPGRRVRVEVESVAGVQRARRVDIFGGGTR